MSEINLKPCPFCGGEMTVSGSSRLKRFTVSHRGDRECHFYAFEIDWQTVNSIAEAIEAWNKRAEPVSDVPNKEIFTASVRIEPEDIEQWEVMSKIYEQGIMKMAETFKGCEYFDVAPVVHGKWVYDEHDDMFHCSECRDSAVSNVYNYCMWCGAKMDGRRSDDA